MIAYASNGPDRGTAVVIDDHFPVGSMMYFSGMYVMVNGRMQVVPPGRRRLYRLTEKWYDQVDEVWYATFRMMPTPRSQP